MNAAVSVPANGRKALSDEFVRRYLAWSETDLHESPSPWYTINAGLAGTAYAFLRLGEIDARLADVARTLSRYAVDNLDALETPEECTALRVSSSLFHSVAGPWLVRSLVQFADSEFDDGVVSLRRAIDVLTMANRQLDVTLGSSGLLLAATLVKRRVSALPDVVLSEISSVAEARCSEIVNVLERENSPLVDDNFAHGLAGVLYAILYYSETFGRPVETGVREKLDALFDRAKSTEDGGTYWDPIPFASAWGAKSWCNGAAGHVHLWLLAHRIYGSSVYLQRAIDTAYFAGKTPGPNAFLCCGVLGASYALEAVYRSTGEVGYLKRAEQLAELSAQQLVRTPRPEPQRQGLFSGEAGAVLLFHALKNHVAAPLPIVEG